MNWLDEEVEFYDFIWTDGVDACPECVNQELFEDFEVGGDKFEKMKSVILKKFPTKEDAIKAFLESHQVSSN